MADLPESDRLMASELSIDARSLQQPARAEALVNATRDADTYVSERESLKSALLGRLSAREAELGSAMGEIYGRMGVWEIAEDYTGFRNLSGSLRLMAESGDVRLALAGESGLDNMSTVLSARLAMRRRALDAMENLSSGIELKFALANSSEFTEDMRPQLNAVWQVYWQARPKGTDTYVSLLQRKASLEGIDAWLDGLLATAKPAPVADVPGAFALSFAAVLAAFVLSRVWHVRAALFS